LPHSIYKERGKAVKAKIEVLKPSFIRPTPRPIIALRPEDVRDFVNTREYDVLRVLNTPAVAEICLELNREDNRSISKHKLAQIARDMEHGQNALFKENGDTIKFDWNGRMFDGQKRERAIIASDTPQIMSWAIGLDPEAHFVTDKGQKRSLGDSLRIEGYSHYTIVAASAQWMYLLKYSNQERAGLDGKIGLDPRQSGSDEEVYEIIKRHPGLLKAVSFCHSTLPSKRVGGFSRSTLIPVSLIAAIYHLASTYLGKEDEAACFVSAMVKFPLDTAYPHALERKSKMYNPVSLWLRWVKERQEAGVYVRREVKGTGTIQAWNLYSEGKWLDKFKLSKFSAISGLNLDVI